jgi:hypothetical protein
MLAILENKNALSFHDGCFIFENASPFSSKFLGDIQLVRKK